MITALSKASRALTPGCSALSVSRAVIGRHASSLVVAEHTKSGLSGGTLSTITAALHLKGEVTVLLAGKSPELDAAAKQAASVRGVTRVLVADHAAYDGNLAENVSQAVLAAHKAGGYSHILAPSSMHCKNLIPRVAALLDAQPITDVLKVQDESTFVRPLYAGNAIATVKTAGKVKVLTVRGTAFEKAPVGGNNAKTEAAPAVANPDAGVSDFVSENVSESSRPELSSARIVISGGRGLKGKDNFALLEALADKLKAAVGASRAAVDEFQMPNELQVGQTGKVVAPDLYIAVGISGAIQHLSGMKDSKVIVAINKDKEAPIFQVADYGLVADCFKAVPELTQKL